MGSNGVDAKLKSARENLVANFLIDEDGKNKKKAQKKYVDLTTPQLSTIVESLSVRFASPQSVQWLISSIYASRYPSVLSPQIIISYI